MSTYTTLPPSPLPQARATPGPSKVSEQRPTGVRSSLKHTGNVVPVGHSHSVPNQATLDGSHDHRIMRSMSPLASHQPDPVSTDTWTPVPRGQHHDHPPPPVNAIIIHPLPSPHTPSAHQADPVSITTLTPTSRPAGTSPHCPMPTETSTAHAAAAMKWPACPW